MVPDRSVYYVKLNLCKNQFRDEYRQIKYPQGQHVSFNGSPLIAKAMKNVPSRKLTRESLRPPLISIRQSSYISEL